jgi:AraC-like DNA-binding protein
VTVSGVASTCLGEHLNASPALARLNGLHVGGVHVFDVAFHPNGRLPRHEHANARFSFILAGSIGESFVDHSMRCERNALSFHPATMPHRNEMSGEGARALLIEVCGDETSDMAELIRSRSAPFAVSQRRLRDVAVDLSRVLRIEEPVQAILIESLVLDFMARALRLLDERVSRRIGAPAWLDDFDPFIDARLDQHLSATDSAARMRVTPRQLATALQRHRGTTFPAFIRQRRLRRAKELLHGTHLPIAEVALAAGFADQSHLTRCFSDSFGITPSGFRRQAGTPAGNPF